MLSNMQLRFPSSDYAKVYLCVGKVKQPLILHSEHAFDKLTISYDFESLLADVKRSAKTCYWNVFGRFKFFVDLDIYRAPGHTTTVEEVLSLVSKMCDRYLVCETSVKMGHTSYSIHTDRVVDFQEAMELEKELVTTISASQPKTYQKFRRFAGDETRTVPICVVDPIFYLMEPFAYRRSPFSLHGHCKNSRSIPRLDLSNMPSTMFELDLFKFSYPNMIGDEKWT